MAKRKGNKKKNWVEYKELKKKVSLEMALRRYGVFSKLKESGKNLTSVCPIHQGSNPSQFSVNLERNLWNCFGDCKEGGNVIDFVAMMEFGNKDNESIRQAALLIKNWFLTELEAAAGDKGKTTRSLAERGPKKSNKLIREKMNTEEEPKINQPLKFELKSLNPEHSWFDDRGIEPNTVKHFGLGFSTKGIMKDRIAIPIHDHQGQLVAYCGRAITDEQIEEEGKYKQPGDFLKSLVVYNLHRQAPGQKILILVESFISVWWLYQAGFENVVALMGSKLCSEQKKRILDYFKGRKGGVLLAFDADEDGLKCTEQCLIDLSKELFVRWIDIAGFGRKPHQLKPADLQKLIS